MIYFFVLLGIGLFGCKKIFLTEQKTESAAKQLDRDSNLIEPAQVCDDKVLMKSEIAEERMTALNECAESYLRLEKQRVAGEWKENGKVWSNGSDLGESDEKLPQQLSQIVIAVGSPSAIQTCFLDNGGPQDFSIKRDTIVRALHTQIRHVVHFYGNFMERLMGVEPPPFSRIEICSAPGLAFNRTPSLSLQGTNLKISLGMGLFGLQTLTHNDLMSKWDAGQFENALPAAVWPFFNPVGSTRVSIRRATVSIRNRALEYLETLNLDKNSKAQGFRTQLKALLRAEISTSTMSSFFQKQLLDSAECVADEMQSKNELREFARAWLAGVAHPSMSPGQAITQTLWTETAARSKNETSISLSQTGAWVNVGNWHQIEIDFSWKNREQDIRKYMPSEPENLTEEKQTQANLNVTQFAQIVNVYTIDQVRVNVDLSGFFDLSNVFRRPFFAQALDTALMSYQGKPELGKCF